MRIKLQWKKYIQNFRWINFKLKMIISNLSIEIDRYRLEKQPKKQNKQTINEQIIWIDQSINQSLIVMIRNDYLNRHHLRLLSKNDYIILSRLNLCKTTIITTTTTIWIGQKRRDSMKNTFVLDYLMMMMKIMIIINVYILLSCYPF